MSSNGDPMSGRGLSILKIEAHRIYFLLIPVY